MTEEIRIGIACNGLLLPHWQAQCLLHLAAQPGVRIVAVGMPLDPEGMPYVAGPRQYLDQRLAQLIYPRASAPVDLTGMLGSLPVVNVPAGELDAGVQQGFVGHGAQWLLSFMPHGFIPTTGVALPCWEFDFNGTGLGPQGLPAFKPWMLREPSASCGLTSASHKNGFSTTYTTVRPEGGLDADGMLLCSSWLPVEVVRASRQERHGTNKDVQGKPSPRDTEQEGIGGLAALWIKAEFRHWREQRSEKKGTGEWNIGILHQPITSLLADGNSTNVRWLSHPSQGSHRIEPFGYIAPDGQLNVLYRKMRQDGSPDGIARIRPKGDGVLKRSRAMLSTSASLGYPFIVQRSDGAYVVIGYPHQRRTELFRVAGTNDGLDHVKTLLDAALVNPTCVEHQGRWWLLGTDVDAPDGVLHAYHAMNFDGPYTPHRDDPVKMAGSKCRPAGTFFLHEGALWRPSFDNTVREAPAVVLNRVTELSLERFAEEEVRSLHGFRGTYYPHGIRTICGMGELTIIDGYRAMGEKRTTGNGTDSTSTRGRKARRS